MSVGPKLAGLCILLSFAAACGRPEGTPVLAKDVTDFNTLFAENCAGCHGVGGKNGPAPILNDPLYLTIVPKDALRHTIESGVPGTPMPAFAQSEGGELYPAQVDALLNGMGQKWARPVEWNGLALPVYSASGGAPDTAQGKQVFMAACARCHSDQGKAGSIENASFLTLISDQGLRTSTIVGRPDFGVPNWRGYIPEHALTDQEITNVVGYLVSLRPASGAQKQP